MLSKPFPILIICLLFLAIPLVLLGQFDNFWIMDESPINDSNGIESEITLKSLELRWSADTYVPFGYQGRALPTKESWVIVEADLKISGENPKNLKYSWFLDDVFQELKSGYGRDGFKFGVRRFNGASHTALLKVFNESRSFLVEKSITIPIVNPDLVIYRKENAQINLPYTASAKIFDIVSNEESSFLALPYFFNIKSLEDLEFNWILGDKSVKESSLIANIFGLKITNKEVGGMLEENLKVITTNKIYTDQKVQKTIKINIY